MGRGMRDLERLRVMIMGFMAGGVGFSMIIRILE